MAMLDGAACGSHLARKSLLFLIKGQASQKWDKDSSGGPVQWVYRDWHECHAGWNSTQAPALHHQAQAGQCKVDRQGFVQGFARVCCHTALPLGARAATRGATMLPPNSIDSQLSFGMGKWHWHKQQSVHELMMRCGQITCSYMHGPKPCSSVSACSLLHLVVKGCTAL